MISPARLAAYRTLMAVESGRSDLPSALSSERARLADPRDRNLAAEITIGTLRWRARLDWIIETAAHRALARIDPTILEILRLSTYQILFLDRVPVSAAVNDAVHLSRLMGKTSAAGFVNGVLRTVTRKRSTLSGPPAPSSKELTEADGFERVALDYLSITLSHPRWLAARWMARYGFEEAEGREQFDNTAAPLTLRVNTLKTSTDALQASLAQHAVSTRIAHHAPQSLIVTAGNPLQTPLANAGLFQIQDEASQLVAALTGVRPGERVLDACAAPGGKTLVMCAMMEDCGLIVANDARPRRVGLLRQTVAASGARSIRILQADLARTQPFRARFDCVLIDAPCSGLGTLRRDPDIRWRRTEDDLPRFADAQLALLTQTAPLVEPGGRIVYATCSSEPDENDDVVDAFLEAQPSFAPVHPASIHGSVPPGLAAVLDEQGRLRTSPTEHGLEAFFGVVLRRVR